MADPNIINAIVDVIVAVFAFGGGIGVAFVTQKHTDDRHDKDIDIQKDEDVDKKIDNLTSKYTNDIASVRQENKANFDAINKQLGEMKVLFADMKSTYEKNQSVTEIKIQQLTDECRMHNGVIERTYKLESKTDLHEEQIKVANKRLADLERHEEQRM